jgi:hypothetical protein
MLCMEARMFGVDDIVEVTLGGPWGLALVAGGAAAMIAGPRAKPLAKQAIKGYFAATQRVREVAGEAVEQVQDLYAEAKYEYQSELEETDAAPAPEKAPRSRRTPTTQVEEQPA